MTSREEVLARIRSALSAHAEEPGAYAGIPRTYERTGTLGREACLNLLKDRLLDYDAEVIEIAEEEGEGALAGAIGTALQHAGDRRIVVAAEFPIAWLPRDVEVAVDHELAIGPLDRAEAVVTTCEAAVASTGSIILVHDGAQGRRALTLLPDHHICLVRRSQVFELVPEALTSVAARSHLPITTISGPSATSDIEMTRIRGVHGPRRLTVVLF